MNGEHMVKAVRGVTTFRQALSEVIGSREVSMALAHEAGAGLQGLEEGELDTLLCRSVGLLLSAAAGEWREQPASVRVYFSDGTCLEVEAQEDESA